jgi:phosphoglucomutase
LAARANPSSVDPELEPNSIVTRDGTFIEPEERLAMIAEAAYYRAEQRGFDPGHEIDDWLAAEAAFDESLVRGTVATACGD